MGFGFLDGILEWKRDTGGNYGRPNKVWGLVSDNVSYVKKGWGLGRNDVSVSVY